ncbi:MAG: carboxypeptidase regulatory-like domain-containing protein [Bryobacterales bacterium]|nr:carboxypeptidase regulatory-like domain-containing protein [Bryobacterales bacterium]
MFRFFSLLLLVVSCGYSQSSSATKCHVVGSVRDPAGASITGATIKVTNPATRSDHESVTDATGAYRIPFLSPGEYSLSAMAPGFRPELVRRVPLTVNQTARLDFALQLESVDQQIEVQAMVPLLNTDTATLGQVIESKQILELPLRPGASPAPKVMTITAAAAPRCQEHLAPASLRFALGHPYQFESAFFHRPVFAGR